MPPEQSFPIRIFIAYSKHDKLFLDDLLVHFSPAIRNKTIYVFHDGVIEAGKEWNREIKEKLHNSDIILLLVSAYFVATDYCYDEEMTAAIALHEQNKAQVIPIILTYFDFEDAPFAHLSFLPSKAKPISSYTDHNQAYTEIVLALKKDNYPIARQRREQAEKEKETQRQAEKQEHDFLDHYQQGNKALKQGNWEDALEQYSQALKLHQNGYSPTREVIKATIKDCNDEINYPNHLQRAEKYEKQENYAKAIDELHAAIKLKPAESEALNLRIQVLQNKLNAKQEKEKQAEAAKRAEEARQKPNTYTETALGLNLKMQYVEGGAFTMGNNDGYDYEKPVHNVTLKDFYIGVYTITQAQWRAVMGNSPSSFTGDNLPVEQVSWNEVQEFLRKLNAQTGKQYRLPTEAEWEYAARGGKHSNGYKYAGSNDVNEVAWYNENSEGKTHAVGQKAPNELGLYDMSGNVWEWCQDSWHDNYTGAPTDGTAWDSGTLPDRVIRGGSWLNNPQYCRVAFRFFNTPVNRYDFVGFRLVVSQFVQ